MVYDTLTLSTMNKESIESCGKENFDIGGCEIICVDCGISGSGALNVFIGGGGGKNADNGGDGGSNGSGRANGCFSTISQKEITPLRLISFIQIHHLNNFTYVAKREKEITKNHIG
ncbi:hypothetical protein DERP_010562 [Dermatophagoides pteronyssinus]|uniref:Uncharacterized protein n=1 Tax=Dermatophagoides pteronyssinus TaxID=6956 RepID=A0ABQ8JG87_DERPT|nr:hypothetical protein DERP_010562 [Dermatophagoides pteronyssinus]